jgi:hypothetical protein
MNKNLEMHVPGHILGLDVAGWADASVQENSTASDSVIRPIQREVYSNFS